MSLHLTADEFERIIEHEFLAVQPMQDYYGEYLGCPFNASGGYWRFGWRKFADGEDLRQAMVACANRIEHIVALSHDW